MSKFNELVSKLREVFQIDRPELDFGVYRILNARADEINEYLEKRLKEKVEQALATGSAANVDQLKDDLKKAEQAATDAGFDPAESPKVKELQAKITQANSGNAEHENAVFSHLLTFFSRYYDNGDFISQRRYKGDTYAIPYAGEEVMLHWANKDQYYIKSGENFSNYSFKLEDGRVVHFRLVAADTAKDNRKDNDKERRFVLAEQKIINRTDDDGEEYEDEILPVEEVTKTDTAGNEHKELIIRFEYKSMPKGSKQDKLISDAVVRVLTKSLVANRWLDLSKRAPTEKNPKRTLLEKHLTHYTAKNTADYFIHKNLGKFLRGELDFYIKNEVMHLDDVQNAEAFTDIEKNLRMIQCLRSIALDLIRFLAQLEDFQKRLWSKKKFVVAAEYCISVDLIPERLFSDVIKCESQWTEWKSLGFISDIPVVGDRKKELFENKSLTIDTALFGDKFKRDWLLSVGNLDDLTMGWLINSDNYQALNTIEKKYINAIDGIYVDPPYNTDSAEILYKNGYKDSTWCSLISGRLEKSRDFLKQDSMLCITIDEHEVSNLDLLLKETFPGYKVRPIIIEYNHRGRVKNNFAITHEYGLWAIPDGKDLVTRQAEISDEIKRNLRRTGSGSTRAESESQFYGIEVDNESLEIVNVTEALEGLHVQVPINKKSNTTVVWPIDDQGIERRWYYGRDRVIKEAKEGTVWAKKIKGEIQIHYRQPGKPKMRKSVWTGPKLDASTHGSELLNDLFNVTQINFSFPKSLYAVRDCLESLTSNKNAHFLDYFAGSGTTGHAVINMNLKDNGKRKFTLIEQGQYFSSVTLPRIRKALFSDTWKYGKAREGSGLPGVIIKYIRLESYEDALNNLELKRPKIELFDNNPELKEDYLLNYMLDIESRGSLLSTDDFKKPFDYTMKIAVDSAGAFEEQKIDLVETFNYLIGLTVKSYEYEIEKGYVRVEGTLPTGENTLVLWRDCEKIDHEKLIAWENRLNIGGKDNPYDVIYINGDHNIASIYAQTKDEGGETWVRAIRQIEPEFLARMFDEEEV